MIESASVAGGYPRQGFWGHEHLGSVQVILVYSFMALLAHQFEEYTLPGGAPLVLNAAFYGEKADYDRYPGNQRNCLIVNLAAYPFYLAAIVWPGAIWLGLATMFFGFFQVIGHGIVMNNPQSRLVQPGLATALALHLPIGIYYIVFVNNAHLVRGSDYLYGALGFIAAVVLIVILPVQGTKKRDNPYPFTAAELNGFGMHDKLVARGVI